MDKQLIKRVNKIQNPEIEVPPLRPSHAKYFTPHLDREENYFGRKGRADQDVPADESEIVNEGRANDYRLPRSSIIQSRLMKQETSYVSIPYRQSQVILKSPLFKCKDRNIKSSELKREIEYERAKDRSVDAIRN